MQRLPQHENLTSIPAGEFSGLNLNRN